MRMSISGFRERSSNRTQATSAMTAAIIRPITRPEVQPESGAVLSASRRETRPADSRTAASQLMRPGCLTGDSGTNRCAASAASATTIAGIQNREA